MSETVSSTKNAIPFFVGWKDWYSVGHHELDAHHQALLSMINDLYLAIYNHNDRKKVEEIFQGMFDYAKYHFKREEALMLAYDFPDLLQHKQLHSSFIEEVEELHRNFHKPDATSNAKLLPFLKKWWTDHICKEDRKYKTHIQWVH